MNFEQVFLSAEEYYIKVFKEISKASSHVDVNVYILKDDRIGEKLIESLQNAAERGVSCRLLVDGFGSRDWIRKWGRKIEANNLQVKVFNPLSFFWYLDILSWWRYGKKFISQINRRDHKKLILIDSDLCFIGSVNFSQDCLSQKELAVSSKKAVEASLWYFDYTWARSHQVHKKVAVPFVKRIPKAKNFDDSPIRFNYNILNRRKNVKKLFQSIDSSKKRVWFATPYFIPTFFLIKHLIAASKRGVDVRILLPKKIDLRFMRWVAYYYYPIFVKYGVKIYEYQDEFMHQKVSIIDDWYIVGSSNVDHRSFFTNLELDVEVQEKETKKIIMTRIKDDFSRSELIDPTKIKVSLWQKMVRSFVIFLEKRLS